MQSRPAATIAARHPQYSPSPTVTANIVKTRGMTICVTPPPALPQPAVVALAVPMQFGANMTDV